LLHSRKFDLRTYVHPRSSLRGWGGGSRPVDFLIIFTAGGKIDFSKLFTISVVSLQNGLFLRLLQFSIVMPEGVLYGLRAIVQDKSP
jgi:hypothetical protein